MTKTIVANFATSHLTIEHDRAGANEIVIKCHKNSPEFFKSCILTMQQKFEYNGDNSCCYIEYVE